MYIEKKSILITRHHSVKLKMYIQFYSTWHAWSCIFNQKEKKIFSISIEGEGVQKHFYLDSILSINTCKFSTFLQTVLRQPQQIWIEYTYSSCSIFPSIFQKWSMACFTSDVHV